MKKEKINLDSFTLVGLTARTNNKNKLNPETSKIGKLAASYGGNQVANDLKDCCNPGVTYAAYTEYESDENGEYAYFIGEEIKTSGNQDQSKFMTLTAPVGTY